MLFALLAQTSPDPLLQWVDRLGYPVAIGVGMALALWKVLSALAARHMKFVDAIEEVVKSQSASLVTITTSLVAITSEHKSLVGELRTLTMAMASLTSHMEAAHELGVHPQQAVIYPPGGSNAGANR